MNLDQTYECALDSMALALRALGVPEPKIQDAMLTALDAWDNNGPDPDEPAAIIAAIEWVSAKRDSTHDPAVREWCGRLLGNLRKASTL